MFLECRKMIRTAIALVLGESILWVFLVVFDHQAITCDFGND